MDGSGSGEKEKAEKDRLEWSKWQLIDSILPTGGFAHSFGLEAAVQTRVVSTPDQVRAYIIHIVENTASLLLPFVHSAAASPSMENWTKLDTILDATLTNEIARKASIAQGSALLRVAAAVFDESTPIRSMRDAVIKSRSAKLHHAPIFGITCGLIGIDQCTSQRAYLFVTLRDVISAATRLNLVGPLGAAVLQHQISSIAEDFLRKWMNKPVEEACQSSPFTDTLQGCHRYLFSRLFTS